MMTGCCRIHLDPATASHHKHMTHVSYGIYRVVPPDNEQSACSKHVEVNY